MSASTETPVDSDDNTVERMQEVISQTKAEIERSERLFKLIRAVRKKNRPFKKDEPK